MTRIDIHSLLNLVTEATRRVLFRKLNKQFETAILNNFITFMYSMCAGIILSRIRMMHFLVKETHIFLWILSSPTKRKLIWFSDHMLSMSMPFYPSWHKVSIGKVNYFFFQMKGHPPLQDKLMIEIYFGYTASMNLFVNQGTDTIKFCLCLYIYCWNWCSSW